MRLSTQALILRGYVLGHPVNRGRRLRALRDYLLWQVGSRMVPGPVVVEMTGNSRVLAAPGVDGALACVWCGLGEFREMGFAVHLLRSGDLFVDGGANVGTYAVLAAAEAGARGIAFEPAPTAHGWLVRNLDLNACRDRVEARRAALGEEPGTVSFTVDQDTGNHVAAPGERDARTVEVPRETLDQVLDGRVPTLIKLDVEGFELAALRGASRTLAAPGLKALIVEMAGCGERYGLDEAEIPRLLGGHGFEPVTYDPFLRRLGTRDLTRPGRAISFLFVRDREAVEARLRDAPRVRVKETWI